MTQAITASETIKIRAKAASYAQTFLAKKYYDEYKELYDAYLTNRGINVRRSKVIIDERTVTNE
jgi:hypothetical protein